MTKAKIKEREWDNLDVIQRRLSGLHTPRQFCMAQIFNKFLIVDKEVGLGKPQSEVLFPNCTIGESDGSLCPKLA